MFSNICVSLYFSFSSSGPSLCTVSCHLLTLPSAWTTKPIKQDVTYDDPEAVKAALEKLKKLPPLVTPQEVYALCSTSILLVPRLTTCADCQPEEMPAECRSWEGLCSSGRYVDIYTVHAVYYCLTWTVSDMTPGDCAELFDYCNQDKIEAKVKLLLQMSLVLIWGMPPHYYSYRWTFLTSL